MERSQISQKIFWKIVKGLFIQLLEKIISNLYYKMGYFCSKGTFYLSDIFGKDSAAKNFLKWNIVRNSTSMEMKIWKS